MYITIDFKTKLNFLNNIFLFIYIFHLYKIINQLFLKKLIN